MSAGAKTLAATFGMTDFMFPMVLDDLTADQAYVRPRGEGGPSIAWTVGHLLHSRIFVLNVLGHDRANPWAEHFGQASATDGSDYPSMEELRSAWEGLAPDFMSALSTLTDEALDARLEDGWHEEQTLRDQLVFFAWHEGYHVGAIGQIRKSLGLPGPAERVMEARRAVAEEG